MRLLLSRLPLAQRLAFDALNAEGWPTLAKRETDAGAVIITMRRDNSGRRRFGRVVDFGARPYRRGPNFRVVPVVFDGGPGGGMGSVVQIGYLGLGMSGTTSGSPTTTLPSVWSFFLAN